MHARNPRKFDIFQVLAPVGSFVGSKERNEGIAVEEYGADAEDDYSIRVFEEMLFQLSQFGLDLTTRREPFHNFRNLYSKVGQGIH